MRGRCLITGGAGFLGGWLARTLRAEGHEVLAPARAELDVTRAEDLARLGGDFDAVIHAAAFVPPTAAALAEVPAALAAALGTHRVLAWAAARGVRRLVYVSSADVYAAAAALPVAEGAPTNPSGVYGLGKLWGDQLTRAARAAGLSAVCLRFSAIHGPGMRPRGVVSALWREAGAGRPLPVHAPRATGDFLHVADACRAVALALAASAPAPVYNIGSARETTLEELGRAVWAARRPGEPPRLELGDAGGRRFVLDVGLAARELDYAPRLNLAAGLAAWAATEAT